MREKLFAMVPNALDAYRAAMCIRVVAVTEDSTTKALGEELSGKEFFDPEAFGFVVRLVCVGILAIAVQTVDEYDAFIQLALILL
jgi:hypothetical protein